MQPPLQQHLNRDYPVNKLGELRELSVAREVINRYSQTIPHLIHKFMNNPADRAFIEAWHHIGLRHNEATIEDPILRSDLGTYSDFGLLAVIAFALGRVGRPIPGLVPDPAAPQPPDAVPTPAHDYRAPRGT